MNILTEIFDAKREEVEHLRAHKPLVDLIEQCRDMPSTRGFKSKLIGSRHRPSLIAEVKKASPVKGLIREDFDPVEIARAYESAGADCLSVLTDRHFFQGAPEFLTAAREATDLPVLRKDFTVDDYQIYEARSMGADAILLIVNGLSKVQLREYRELAKSLGLDALVEAHTLAEAEIALDSGADFIGINNRDLETFETTLEISLTTIPKIKDRAMVVSESALSSKGQIDRVLAAGARSVLIGTTFCRADDIGSKVREVMGW